MTKRTILEAMKTNALATLSNLSFPLLSLALGETADKETGEISRFLRCEVEVPRGYGALSRCRFSVKIPNGQMKVEESALEEADFIIKFHGLSISYIDDKGNVYFRAEDYEVKKEV